MSACLERLLGQCCWFVVDLLCLHVWFCMCMCLFFFKLHLHVYQHSYLYISLYTSFSVFIYLKTLFLHLYNYIVIHAQSLLQLLNLLALVSTCKTSLQPPAKTFTQQLKTTIGNPPDFPDLPSAQCSRTVPRAWWRGLVKSC